VKEGVQFWKKVRVDGNNCQFAWEETASFRTELLVREPPKFGLARFRLAGHIHVPEIRNLDPL
jgi:hypothetical protein